MLFTSVINNQYQINSKAKIYEEGISSFIMLNQPSMKIYYILDIANQCHNFIFFLLIQGTTFFSFFLLK